MVVPSGRTWADDAAMQHAGDREILQIEVLPGALPRHVGPQERFAHYGIAGRVLQRRLRVDLECQALPSHQRPEVNTRPTGCGSHLAIRQGQFRRWAPEALSTELQEGLAGCRRGLADIHRAKLDAGAATGDSLIGI